MRTLANCNFCDSTQAWIVGQRLTWVCAGIGGEAGALQLDALSLGLSDEGSGDEDLQGEGNGNAVLDVSQEEGESDELQIQIFLSRDHFT